MNEPIDFKFDKIITALKSGAPPKMACDFASCSESAYANWRIRGREYDEHLENGGEIIEGEDMYRQFWLESSRAVAEAHVRAIATIQKAGQDDWRAMAWYLERSAPESWAKISRHELTGAGGGAISVADVTEAEMRLAASVQRAVESSLIEVIDAEIVNEDRKEIEAPTEEQNDVSGN